MEVDFQPGGDTDVSESEMELSHSDNEFEDDEAELTKVKEEQDDSPADDDAGKSEELQKQSCDQCPFGCNNFEELEKHYYTAHPDPSTWKFVCAKVDCGCRFPTSRGLDLHEAYVHAKNKTNAAKNVRNQSLTPAVMYTAIGPQKKDLSSSSPPIEGVPNSPITMVEEETAANSDKQLKQLSPEECEVCRVKFSCEAEVEKHRVEDHKLRDYIRCRTCGNMYASRTSLWAHHRRKRNPLLPNCFVESKAMTEMKRNCKLSHLLCDLCDHQKFRCEGEVEKHRITKHNHRRYISCYLCRKNFASRQNLRKHLDLNKFQACLAQYQKDNVEITPVQFPVQEIFKPKVFLFCPQADCYEVFQFEMLLQTHLKTHGNFGCILCHAKFPKAHEFALHELSEHNPNKELSENDVLKTRTPSRGLLKTVKNMMVHCTRCKLSFKNRDSILTHFLHAHLNIPKVPKTARKVPKIARKVPKRVSDNGKLRGQCKICKRVFGPTATDLYLEQHLQLAHNVEGMDASEISVCSICKAPFTKRSYLTTHLRKVHKQTMIFKCPHCDKQLKDAVQLRAHVVCRHKGKTSGLAGAFQCPICKEKYMTQGVLEWHMRSSHKDDDKSEFKCEICSSTFAKKGYLSLHKINMHKAPKRPHTCDTCGKVFKNKDKFTQHQSYTHTDPSEWKFACPEEGCGKRCWSKQKLTEHIRTHTKECPFICRLCGQAYRYRQYLRSHLAKIHGTSAAKTLPTKPYTKPFDLKVREAALGANPEEDDSTSE